MNKLMFLMALAALSVHSAAAQSPFDGTWKLDFSKVQFPTKPDELLLQDGIYTCKSCIDTVSIKADGNDQSTQGKYPYADTVAIRVVSDHKIEITTKKKGDVVGKETVIVSPDGKTLTWEFWYSPQPGSAPANGTSVETRVADGPAGSHLISGAWVQKQLGLSDNAALVTYKISGNELNMTNPIGQSYTAKLDGTEAVFKGDPGTSHVRVKLIGTDTLEETYLRDGTVLSVSRMTVAKDGKTATVVNDDKRQNTSMTIAAVKQ